MDQSLTSPRASVRLAAMADLHFGREPPSHLIPALEKVSHEADILLLGGDLTDYGLPDEAKALARALTASVKIPIVAVLGNHDFHSGHEVEVRHILEEAGVKVLDGEACELEGIGFAGVKGFAGGFGRGALGPWGEGIIKRFVQEALDEALKLEAALARLRTEHRIVLLHYSPIQATVEGEPVEIFCFLGSSRLEEPLNRYRVTAIFHGHAHRGQPEGRTTRDVPVYNVAMPLLRRLGAEDRPFRVIEVTFSPNGAPQLGRENSAVSRRPMKKPASE